MNRFSKITLSGLTIVLILLATPTVVRAQTICTSVVLQDASRAYEFGRFDTIFRLLSPCLPEGFADRSERSQAYRLQALSYLATDSLAHARRTIRELLRYDPEFEANPDTDPVQFAAFVDGYKPNWYSWLWQGSDWKRWTGRTVLVGAIVAVPLLLKDEPLPDLPGPPTLPN